MKIHLKNMRARLSLPSLMARIGADWNTLNKTIFAVLCFAIAGNMLAREKNNEGKRERLSEEESSSANAGNKKQVLAGSWQAEWAKKWKHMRYKHLYTAIERGDFEAVKSILEKSVLDLDVLIGRWKTTFLHRAAYRNHLEIAKLLIEKGASVDVKMQHGTTALDVAAKYGHEDMALLLIEHGAHLAEWIQPQPEIMATESDEIAPAAQKLAAIQDDMIAMQEGDLSAGETEDQDHAAAQILGNLNQ
jgi:hypothetical protein